MMKMYFLKALKLTQNKNFMDYLNDECSVSHDGSD